MHNSVKKKEERKEASVWDWDCIGVQYPLRSYDTHTHTKLFFAKEAFVVWRDRWVGIIIGFVLNNVQSCLKTLVIRKNIKSISAFLSDRLESIHNVHLFSKRLM